MLRAVLIKSWMECFLLQAIIINLKSSVIGVTVLGVNLVLMRRGQLEMQQKQTLVIRLYLC